MALHGEKLGLSKESIYEMLHVAKYCVNYKKKDKSQWGNNATGGILGFPETIILFSIIDCLGSYFKNDQNFTVKLTIKIDYKQAKSTHLYVNSKYFNQICFRMTLITSTIMLKYFDT
jgi:hypothetical protein